MVSCLRGTEAQMSTPANKRSLVLVVLIWCSVGTACATIDKRFGRTLVCETYGVYRKQIGSFSGRVNGGLVQVLLFQPRHPTRRIGSILGYQDANYGEELLWQSLRVRAAELGAMGIRLLDRRLVECTTPAQVSASSSANAYWSSASGQAVGPRTFECVQIFVEALVWRKKRNCEAEQDCRNDAFALDAAPTPPLRLPVDPRRSECHLPIISAQEPERPRSHELPDGETELVPPQGESS